MSSPPTPTRTAAPLAELRAGDIVRISGARGTVIGQVVEIQPPSALPDLPGTHPADIVRAILEEAGITAVVWLSYTNNHGQRLLFAALRGSDSWVDLQGNLLTVAPLRQTPE